MKQINNNNMAVICHLLAFFGFLGPLIIWLLKKDESSAVDKHGKESLNFQISITIYAAIAWILMFLLIGFVLLPIVLAFNYIMIIIATLKAYNGKTFKYPLCIRLLK